MKVCEFIKLLQCMPQDAEVAVQYRDEGGIYYGQDYELEPHIKDGVVII